MKTSFYFVLWILIYPILGLIGNDFINEHAFFVAIGAVWALSWFLNKTMPETLAYEKISQSAPILEDVYTGNVAAFGKRLNREATVELVTSLYLLVTTFILLYALLVFGISELFALIVFGLLTFAAIRRTAALMKAKSALNANPTGDQCREIAEETYNLNYTAYYEERQATTYEGVFPPRPRHFSAFLIVSLVIAAIAALLGLIYIISGILLLIVNDHFAIGALAGMNFLYGSLAIYFGVRDIITIAQNLKTKKSQPTWNAEKEF